MKRVIVFAVFLYAARLAAQTPEIYLTEGMQIRQSCLVQAGVYLFDARQAGPDSTLMRGSELLLIEGEGITVDFQDAELRSTADIKRPDLFAGLAIRVKGRDIQIKNLRVSGFKTAILAEGVERLTIENCDFSYNYRPRLRSIREREDFSDWLSYHQNEKDEWLRYGAGLYLKNCNDFIVRNCRATGNQNALLMTRCEGGTVYNNTFHFNSGLGIGMYRSSRNRIMHNRLDWNVRGYSHGIYQRGQDSAGILVYEQSSENVFAYNSATHSGDGFFLWAGQTTMDTGQGGCNDNVLFGNDFSHAPTNGVELTFSRNRIAGNLIRECTHGIWGGYSYETVIFGNLISGCQTGIAIEHGQKNVVRQNLFENDSTGINFWARASQPADWAYAQKRDTRSMDGVVDRNVFLSVRKPLKISRSQNMSINGENLFFDFERILETPVPNENLRFLRNDIYGSETEIRAVWSDPNLSGVQGLNFSHTKDPENAYAPLETPVNELNEPDSLRDGMLAALPPDFPRGRQFIIVDEWGPFDFRRPTAVLESVNPEKAVLSLIGPSGDWQVKRLYGVSNVQAANSQIPVELQLDRTPDTDEIWIEFEYTSPETTTTVFGEKIMRGKPHNFTFHHYDKKWDWKLRFFNYDSLQNPLKHPAQFDSIQNRPPAAEKTTRDLYFAWWGKPAEGVQEDRFVSIAESETEFKAGKYRIELTSDDGARLYIDGKRLIDHWDVHEPATDEITVDLNGKHRFRIEHVEAGGFGTLDFRIKPVRSGQ